MPILHCRCGRLIDVGLHGADIRGFPGKVPLVDQGSLRSDCRQGSLSAGILSCARMSVPGLVFTIKEGWLPRARLAELQSTVMHRDCLV